MYDLGGSSEKFSVCSLLRTFLPWDVFSLIPARFVRRIGPSHGSEAAERAPCQLFLRPSPSVSHCSWWLPSSAPQASAISRTPTSSSRSCRPICLRPSPSSTSAAAAKSSAVSAFSCPRRANSLATAFSPFWWRSIPPTSTWRSIRRRSRTCQRWHSTSGSLSSLSSRVWCGGQHGPANALRLRKNSLSGRFLLAQSFIDRGAVMSAVASVFRGCTHCRIQGLKQPRST